MVFGHFGDVLTSSFLGLMSLGRLPVEESTAVVLSSLRNLVPTAPDQLHEWGIEVCPDPNDDEINVAKDGKITGATKVRQDVFSLATSNGALWPLCVARPYDPKRRGRSTMLGKWV